MIVCQGTRNRRSGRTPRPPPRQILFGWYRLLQLLREATICPTADTTRSPDPEFLKPFQPSCQTTKLLLHHRINHPLARHGSVCTRTARRLFTPPTVVQVVSKGMYVVNEKSIFFTICVTVSDRAVYNNGQPLDTTRSSGPRKLPNTTLTPIPEIAMPTSPEEWLCIPSTNDYNTSHFSMKPTNGCSTKPHCSDSSCSHVLHTPSAKASLDSTERRIYDKLVSTMNSR